MRTVAVTIMAALTALPSDLEGQRVLYGFRGGFVEARQIDGAGPSSTLPGFTVGFVSLTEFATWVGIQEDLLYTQKGWRTGTEWTGLDYLEIPVLVRLAVPRTDMDAGTDLGLQPFVVAGPTLSVLLRCFGPNSAIENPNSGNAQVTPPRPPRSANQTFPSDCDGYKQSPEDVGWTLGGGITLRRALQHLTVEVRRTTGLINARRGGALSDCCQRKLINTATSVYVAATFRRK